LNTIVTFKCGLEVTEGRGKKLKVCCTGVMACDSEPGKFFSFDPPNPHRIKISTQTDPLGKHTETFKITNKSLSL